MIVLDHQPVDPVKTVWLLVTLTDHSRPILQVTRYVLPDSPRSRRWLSERGDFTTTVAFEPIQIMAPIVAVHAVLRYTDEKRDFIACGLDDQRKSRHGQSFDQAFHRVKEAVTCGRCKAAMRDNQETIDAAVVEVRDHGATLKPWSWENVPESHRPGGPQHRYTNEGEQTPL